MSRPIRPNRAPASGSLPFYYAYPSVINIWNSGLEDDYNIKLKSQRIYKRRIHKAGGIIATASLTYPPEVCYPVDAYGEQS